MNTVFIKKILMAAICFSVIGAGASFAAPGQGYETHEGYRPALTEEQKDKAKALFDEHRKATDADRQKLIIKEAELKAQIHSVTPDAAKIESISKEIGEIRGRMLAARVKLDTQLEKEGLPLKGPHGGMHDGYDRMSGGHGGAHGPMGGYGPMGGHGSMRGMGGNSQYGGCGCPE